ASLSPSTNAAGVISTIRSSRKAQIPLYVPNTRTGKPAKSRQAIIPRTGPSPCTGVSSVRTGGAHPPTGCRFPSYQRTRFASYQRPRASYFVPGRLIPGGIRKGMKGISRAPNRLVRPRRNCVTRAVSHSVSPEVDNRGGRRAGECGFGEGVLAVPADRASVYFGPRAPVALH